MAIEEKRKKIRRTCYRLLGVPHSIQYTLKCVQFCTSRAENSERILKNCGKLCPLQVHAHEHTSLVKITWFSHKTRADEDILTLFLRAQDVKIVREEVGLRPCRRGGVREVSSSNFWRKICNVRFCKLKSSEKDVDYHSHRQAKVNIYENSNKEVRSA